MTTENEIHHQTKCCLYCLSFQPIWRDINTQGLVILDSSHSVDIDINGSG